MDLLVFSSDCVWYSPDYKDNRDKPEAERFAVSLTPLSAGDLRRVEEVHGKLTKAKINFTKRYNAIRLDSLRRCIQEVKNLFVVEVKGSVKTRVEIKDVDGLLRVCPEEIIEDIFSALRDHSQLEEGVLGKSVAGCDLSTSLPAKKELGVAQTATLSLVENSREIQTPRTQSLESMTKQSGESAIARE